MRLNFPILIFKIILVNDLLPKETELKVRYQPLADGEVLGYLRRGQVIECLAVIGDWLQVRFEGEDAAWVRWKITSPGNKSFLGSIFGSAGGNQMEKTHAASSSQLGVDTMPESIGRRSLSSTFGLSRSSSASGVGKSTHPTSTGGTGYLNCILLVITLLVDLFFVVFFVALFY